MQRGPVGLHDIQEWGRPRSPGREKISWGSNSKSQERKRGKTIS